MSLAGDGHVQLGLDGVVRSYSGNGTVVDYRQLDPDQVVKYSASLRKRDSILPRDGREVTDIAQLLAPWEERDIATAAELAAREPANNAAQVDSLRERGGDDFYCDFIECTNNDICFNSQADNTCAVCVHYVKGVGYCT
jgi:hypothetical protein